MCGSRHIDLLSYPYDGLIELDGRYWVWRSHIGDREFCPRSGREDGRIETVLREQDGALVSLTQFMQCPHSK